MSDVAGIAVIGAGTMGSGIALAAAAGPEPGSGLRAWQVDVKPEQLEKARAYHRSTLERQVEKGRLTKAQMDAALGRISYHRDMAEAAEADWAVEAVLESLDLKQAVFRQMQKVFRSDIVLATNTSSISISRVAEAVAKDAGRVIGMHFFNPVPVMKLVEVIQGERTSPETTERTIRLAQAMGKTPVPARDRPGFVSNRVLMPMINEAFHAWGEGVAEPQHIDEIMKLGCAFPMGPLRLADYIGLDVCVDIMRVMERGLGSPKYAPAPKLVELVKQGRLGDKTGRGVFEYSRK
jgi:3-hydroxybutyryl-CoA dehydrogenase